MKIDIDKIGFLYQSQFFRDGENNTDIIINNGLLFDDCVVFLKGIKLEFRS